MKKLMNTSMALLIGVFLGAQAMDNNSIYLSAEGSFGNYVGGNQNVNFIFNENVSLQIGYSLNVRKPYDYELSDEDRRILVLTFGLGVIGMFDSFISTRILIGRPLWLNESKRTRLNLLGGIGFNSIGIYRDKYSNIGKEVSVIIHPKFEFINKPLVGTSISFIVEANPKSTLFGLGLGCMFGKLRKKSLD